MLYYNKIGKYFINLYYNENFKDIFYKICAKDNSELNGYKKGRLY